MLAKHLTCSETSSPISNLERHGVPALAQCVNLDVNILRSRMKYIYFYSDECFGEVLYEYVLVVEAMLLV